MTTDTDILIAGGGIAGLSAAVILGARGWRVTLAAAEGARADRRTTALLTPSVTALTEAGAWAGLEAAAAPLRVMRIIDAGGPDGAPRETRDFDAAEIQDAPFGWNIPNAALAEGLRTRIATLQNVRMLTEAVTALTTRLDGAIVRLSGGDSLRAKLVIGADGRDSTIRKAAGIGARRLGYGQTAIVFTVAHDRPHQGVSTEVHMDGGPFTLAPLPDQTASAVVWMTGTEGAAELMALDGDAFQSAANARSAGAQGALCVTSAPQAWPIISQIAERLTDRRVALVAEAAHVMPPIGAQGLNTSIADITMLASCLSGHGDPGAESALSAYQRRRWPEVAARMAGVDALNRASQTGIPVLKDLRRLGLGALHGAGPLRRLAMRTGLGGRARRDFFHSG